MTRVPASFDLLSSTIGRLKLRRLSLVLAIIETRNLHRAAERLNLSQPAAIRPPAGRREPFGRSALRAYSHT